MKNIPDKKISHPLTVIIAGQQCTTIQAWNNYDPVQVEIAGQLLDDHYKPSPVFHDNVKLYAIGSVDPATRTFTLHYKQPITWGKTEYPSGTLFLHMEHAEYHLDKYKDKYPEGAAIVEVPLATVNGSDTTGELPVYLKSII